MDFIGKRMFVCAGCDTSAVKDQHESNRKSQHSRELAKVNLKDQVVYAGGTGRIIVSNDAGLSWTSCSTDGINGDIYSLAFTANDGWASGQQGMLLHTGNN